MSLLNAPGHNLSKALVRRGVLSIHSTPPLATVTQTHTYSTNNGDQHLKDAAWQLSFEAWTLQRKTALHQVNAKKLVNDAKALGDEAKELNALAKRVEDKLESLERGVIYALSCKDKLKAEAKGGRVENRRANDKGCRGDGAIDNRHTNDTIDDFEDGVVAQREYAARERRLDYGSS